MNLHEYQGKQLFAEYGLPVSKGFAASTPEEARQAAEQIGGDVWVVKAQVHAGGRGKAGGVKVAQTESDALKYAEQILALTIGGESRLRSTPGGHYPVRRPIRHPDAPPVAARRRSGGSAEDSQTFRSTDRRVGHCCRSRSARTLSWSTTQNLE